MQDIIDFVNGVTRRLSKSELEELVKLGVKPISRDVIAIALKEKYDFETTFKSIINIATPNDSYDLEATK